MLLSALYHTPQHWLFTLRAAITGDDAKPASGGGQSSPGGIAVHPLSSVGKFPPYGFPFPWALLGATQFQLFGTPACAPAAETVPLGRTLKAECRMRDAESFSCRRYSLDAAEIEPTRQTAPPRRAHAAARLPLTG